MKHIAINPVNSLSSASRNIERYKNRLRSIREKALLPMNQNPTTFPVFRNPFKTILSK